MKIFGCKTNVFVGFVTKAAKKKKKKKKKKRTNMESLVPPLSNLSIKVQTLNFAQKNNKGT